MVIRYRSGSILALGWALVGVAVIILFGVLRQNFSSDSLLVAILISALAWLVALRPAILVYEHALVIQNVFRKYEIPWAAITQISSSLLLIVRTEDGKTVTSWAISSSARSRIRGETSRADEIAFELENYRNTYNS